MGRYRWYSKSVPGNLPVSVSNTLPVDIRSVVRDVLKAVAIPAFLRFVEEAGHHIM